jgi:cellulose synthase/poly-beta-1,6-N-acetylglucosamine synthase-like glycosyltransferase
LQTVRPLEVIVVDNNSTDETVMIARSFDFVTVLTEVRQGVVHARTTGFDASRGEIIARIDADSLLPADWVARIQKIFADQGISAVSGAPHYYDFAWSKTLDKLDFYFRARLARQLGDTNFLWGANMALRRSAWLETKHELCHQRHIHEDFDLGIHMQARGHKVAYDETLVAGVSTRRIDTNFLDFIRYTLRSPRTYAQHGLSSRRHMYPVVGLCWIGYLPGRVIYRGYDESGKFSLKRLFALSEARVDPTANVI